MRNSGKTLMSLIAADGSENAVKPLVKFLDDSREAIDLRSSIKKPSGLSLSQI